MEFSNFEFTANWKGFIELWYGWTFKLRQALQDKKILWWLVILVRHIGHLLSVALVDGELSCTTQSRHRQTWPQGWSTTSTGLPKHTEHLFVESFFDAPRRSSSRSFKFSSLASWAVLKKNKAAKVARSSQKSSKIRLKKWPTLRLCLTVALAAAAVGELAWGLLIFKNCITKSNLNFVRIWKKFIWKYFANQGNAGCWLQNYC